MSCIDEILTGRWRLGLAISALMLMSAAGGPRCLAQDANQTQEVQEAQVAEEAAEDAESSSGKSAEDAAAEDAAAQAELAALRGGVEEFTDRFNKQDAEGIAALWTEDGEYIDESGRRFEGRKAITEGYASFFAENPKAKIQIMVDSLRLLSDSAAIEDGRAVVEPAAAGAPAISAYSAVHVKVDGQWLMATVRDTRIETPSAYPYVADLDWLIGTWTADAHGAKSQSVCRWVANKSFVERQYEVTHADGTSMSGVQLIGWNPLDGHVQSWDFSSDGGHAVGIWTPRAGGWTAEMRGMLGDGTPTSSVNLLNRLDDNAYVWQSIQRMVGDTPLPDTEEVVLKRQTDSE